MPRCPDFLNPADFDKLAASIGATLSDTGVSAIGEIAEFLSIQLLELALFRSESQGRNKLTDREIIDAAEALGINVRTGDGITKTLVSACLSTIPESLQHAKI